MKQDVKIQYFDYLIKPYLFIRVLEGLRVIGHGNEICYIYEFISYISYYVNSYKGASS